MVNLLNKYLSIYIISLVILNTYSTPIENDIVIDITDSNYSSIIKSSSSKWLLVFSIPTCPHCQIAKDNIKSIVDKQRLDLIENNMKIGFINCNDSNYLCVSYGIETVPHILIYIDDRVVLFNSNSTYENLKRFIFDDHSEKQSKPAPEILSTIRFGIKMVNEGLKLLNIEIDKYLVKYGFKFKWNIYYSGLLFGLVLLLLILIEVGIIIICCRKKVNNKKVKVEEKKEEELKEEEDLKEEENKENDLNEKKNK